MINKIEIAREQRIAFQAALVARPAGLLVFSILIAHRWSFSEIASFESLSVFQYLVFFAWLPSWGAIMLRLAGREEYKLQKPFLFSNLVLGGLIFCLVFGVAGLFRQNLMPGLPVHSAWWFKIFILMALYYLQQAGIYLAYLKGRSVRQWILAALVFSSWIYCGIFTYDLSSAVFAQIFFSVGIWLLQVHDFVFDKLRWYAPFWKEVLWYSLYTLAGGAGILLAAYYVQDLYGPGREFNWFRYGTREIPVLPALLAAFGYSYLKTGWGGPGIEFLSGISRQIKWLILPLALFIVFARPVFAFVFGPRFGVAGDLMSIYLLIYIPRMIYSQVVLQAKDEAPWLFWLGLAELTLMILAALLLVPLLGIESLVWILVGGTVFEKIIQMAVLKYRFAVSPSEYLPLPGFYIWAATLTAAYFVSHWI